MKPVAGVCSGALLGVVLAVSPALAVSGHVVTGEGSPLGGASVCLIVAGREGTCTTTDSRGYYALPEIGVSSVRIAATGFFPRRVAAVDQEALIVLEPAATLLARLVDARTNRSIPSGEVTLTFPSGKQSGPFPVNEFGVRSPPLEPGEVIPIGKSKGYAESRGPVVVLVVGKVTEVSIPLQPSDDPAAPSPP